MIPETYLNSLIERAYKEDVGDGDHSSLACIDASATGKAKLIAKANGVLAGVEVAKKVCQYFSPNLKTVIYINDGEKIKKGDLVLEISGSRQEILKVERTMLNFMQRMSGIATETAKYAEALKPYKTKILDTRKTTPGLRLIEKEAVKIGGGKNHRIGLYDMIMLKDNHIDFAGGLEKAINKTNQYLKDKNLNLKIEIEVRNIDELKKVLEVGNVDIIMLDNFNIADTKLAVELIDGRYKIESSGGITFETLTDYAKCGVDYISSGALTHHVKSLDLSLIVEKA